MIPSIETVCTLIGVSMIAAAVIAAVGPWLKAQAAKAAGSATAAPTLSTKDRSKRFCRACDAVDLMRDLDLPDLAEKIRQEAFPKLVDAADATPTPPTA